MIFAVFLGREIFLLFCVMADITACDGTALLNKPLLLCDKSETISFFDNIVGGWHKNGS